MGKKEAVSYESNSSCRSQNLGKRCDCQGGVGGRHLGSRGGNKVTNVPPTTLKKDFYAYTPLNRC